MWYYVCIVYYVVMYVHMCTLMYSDVESVITCYYMYVQLDTYEHSYLVCILHGISLGTMQYTCSYPVGPCIYLFGTCFRTSQDVILDPFPYTLLEGFGGFLKYLLMPEYTGMDMEYVVYVTSVEYLFQVLNSF